MTSIVAVATLHLMIAAALLVGLAVYLYWYFVWVKSFTQLLQANHPTQWEQLGKPCIPSTSLRSSAAYVKFLMAGHYRCLHDGALTEIGDRLRLTNWVALATGGLVLVVELLESISH